MCLCAGDSVVDIQDIHKTGCYSKIGDTEISDKN